MAVRHWDGTAWVPFNELLSRFGDANARPVIKHYQAGVFGLGWYPLRTIRRWDGTAWVDVWQARQPAPPPPPKPDPVTGITPPPPPPPPVQGPVIFNDEGVPMQLNDAGEIVPFNQTPGNFDTSFTDLTDIAIGSFIQQQALIRRNVGNLNAARAGSITRTGHINSQKEVYLDAGNTPATPSRTEFIRNLRRIRRVYNERFAPSRFAVNSLIALINSAIGVRRQFDSVAALSTDIRLLRTAIRLAINQRDIETTANNNRTSIRNRIRTSYNSNRRISRIFGLVNVDEPFLPVSSGD